MTYKSTVNTGLPNIPESTKGEDFAEFYRVYNAIRNLAVALDSYTGQLQFDTGLWPLTTPSGSLLTQNHNRLYVPFSAAASYGQVINLYSNAGVLTARLASAADATKPMHGWCNVSGGVLLGGYGEVILGGLCTVISGLTPGTTYYLSNTPGSISSVAGTSPQKIGYALGVSNLFVNPDLI